MASISEQILGFDDLPREEVTIPEWRNMVVHVRTMTAGERDRFEAAHVKNPSADFRARLAAATVCDETGNLVFTADQIPLLSRKSAAALDRIVEVASRLSKLSEVDVEELEGNSEASPSEGSASGSH